MKIKVVVHPNSKPPRIIKDLLQTLHIYVGEPALENRANKAVVEALAEFYKIPKSCVKLVAGEKSKSKVFELVLTKIVIVVAIFFNNKAGISALLSAGRNACL